MNVCTRFHSLLSDICCQEGESHRALQQWPGSWRWRYHRRRPVAHPPAFPVLCPPRTQPAGRESLCREEQWVWIRFYCIRQWKTGVAVTISRLVVWTTWRHCLVVVILLTPRWINTTSTKTVNSYEWMNQRPSRVDEMKYYDTLKAAAVETWQNITREESQQLLMLCPDFSQLLNDLKSITSIKTDSLIYNCVSWSKYLCATKTGGVQVQIFVIPPQFIQ